MAIDQKFRKKYQRLVEYKVQDLNNSVVIDSGQQTGFIKEEDPTPGSTEPEIDQNPVEMPVGDESQEVKPEVGNKLEKKTEILKDLAQNHTEKIDSILHYLENMTNEIEVIKQKEQELDVLKGHVGQLEKQVEFLTPPTPEESLDKMIRISGGQSVDNYWKEYLAKNGGRTMSGTLPYYAANGNTSGEPANIEQQRYSDDEIKKSLDL